MLHSAAEKCEDCMCTHVTLGLSYVDEKEEKIEEALAKLETRDEEA
jgi:hypothetical protein